MKLLSVAVENYRVLKTARLAFDPARTVVGGPQETGKSTLVEAIHHAFFLKSRGTSNVHKSMQSDLHGGQPTVTLSFETGGRHYTITKVFAGNAAASTTMLTDEGPAAGGAARVVAGAGGVAAGGRTLRGDEAETRIHDLLRAENIGSRTVDSRLKMQWSHLWVWQGTSGHDPVSQANSEKPAEQLRDRLGRLGGGGVLESSLDASAAREIVARHAAIFRNDGGIKTGSELARADEESQQAEGAFATATALVGSLDAAVDTVDLADRTITTAQARLAPMTPPPTATMLVSLPGRLFQPQVTTVPSPLTARLWQAPAAIATTLVRSGGTTLCSQLLIPHAITVPLLFKAMQCCEPAAIARMPVKPAAPSSNPNSFPPQTTTVPSSLSAML